MKAIYSICCLLLSLVAFTSCNKDDEMYVLPNQPDEMHVKSSVDEIVLDESKANEVAVTFNWSAATSPVADYESITYMLRIYATESEKENTTTYYQLGEKTQFSLTHEDLNAIVLGWVGAGTELTVTAEVIATVNNEVKYIKPEVSTVNFKIVGYEPTASSIAL